MAIKELVEVLAGQRGNDPAVTLSGIKRLLAINSVGVWSPLTYTNSWVDYSAPYSPCGFCKLVSGLVLLRGLTMSGTAAAICTLPVGYRPGIQLLFIAETSPNAACRLDLTTGGVLSHTGGNNGWISLNNICFLAEN